MFFNYTQPVFRRLVDNAYLESGVSSALSYYVVGSTTDLQVASIEFKLEKQSGRDTTTLVAWTSVDISTATGGVYSIPVTATGSSTDSLLLTLRVTLDTGSEFFLTDNEVVFI